MKLTEPDAALLQAFTEWLNERIMFQLVHIRGLRYQIEYPASTPSLAALFMLFKHGAVVNLEIHRNQDDSLLLVRLSVV
jgi:hypothetical protein